MSMKTEKIGKNLYRTEFSFNKSEMTGHTLNLNVSGFSYPQSLTKEEIKSYRNSMSFGYRDLSSGATPEGIAPKPEDFIPFPFRLLSATVVAPFTWRATEFTENVLKKSVKLITDKPVFTEHYTGVDNVIGTVKSPKWVNASTENGENIPGGMDGVLLLDSKICPTICRNLMSGSLFSNSVTVVFDWKPSHEFEDPYEFRKNIGKPGSDGKMVRRVATEIHAYRESSIVYLGADPYAKLRSKDDGTLVQIEHGTTYNLSFEKEPDNVKTSYTEGKSYSISCGMSKEILSLAQGLRKIPFPGVKNLPKMNEKFIAALYKVMGIATGTDPETLTEEQLADVVKLSTGQKVVSLTGETSGGIFIMEGEDALKGLSVEGLTKDNLLSFDTNFVPKSEKDAETDKVTKLTKDVEILSKDKKRLEPLAKAGETFLQTKRKEVIRLYKAAALDKATPAVIALFENANVESLDGLLKQYTTDAAELTFKGVCKDCNSNNFTFQHSMEDEAGDKGGKAAEELSAEAVQNFVPNVDAFRQKFGKSTLY